MFRKAAVILIGLITMAALAVLWGCSGDEGPAGPTGAQGPQGELGPAELNIIASFSVYEDDKVFDIGHFVASIHNSPSIPDLTLNSHNLFPDGEWLFGGWRLAYYNYVDLDRTDSAFLDISYIKLDGTDGAAASAISLPTDFSAIDNSIFIDVGDDTEAEWEMSAGANAYWVYTYFFFNYYDTTGEYHNNYLEYDTVLAADDTTLMILGSDIFPDPATVDYFTGFDGYFYVRAVTGPWLPGEANNFTGDAFGIFVGITDFVYIDVSIPRKTSEKAIVGEDIPYNQEYVDELFNQRVTELSRNRTR